LRFAHFVGQLIEREKEQLEKLVNDEKSITSHLTDANTDLVEQFGNFSLMKKSNSSQRPING
jgi:hypothetical protein